MGVVHEDREFTDGTAEDEATVAGLGLVFGFGEFLICACRVILGSWVRDNGEILVFTGGPNNSQVVDALGQASSV